MVILTDGQEWQFFLPAEQGDYGERRVYKLDIVERELDETASRLERYLSYPNVCSGAAVGAAREDYKNVSRQREAMATLPKAWKELVKEEDEGLIELLATRVENLCGYRPDPDTVAAFLSTDLVLKTSPPPIITPPPPPPPGQLGFTLKGQFMACRSARDVLVKVFEKLAEGNPGFLERFAALPKHGKTRRYLARTPDELYPGRPDLARDHSHELRSGWWLGTNLSRNSIRRILEKACEVARVSYGIDLKVSLGD